MTKLIAVLFGITLLAGCSLSPKTAETTPTDTAPAMEATADAAAPVVDPAQDPAYQQAMMEAQAAAEAAAQAAATTTDSGAVEATVTTDTAVAQ